MLTNPYLGQRVIFDRPSRYFGHQLGTIIALDTFHNQVEVRFDRVICGSDTYWCYLSELSPLGTDELERYQHAMKYL